MSISARWAGTSDGGLQHLSLMDDGIEIHARGTVVGARSDKEFGLFFQLRLDRAWHVRGASFLLCDGRSLVLQADGKGRWVDAQGGPLPALDGCVDIDISATPFTNTLPIRRLGLKEGERRPIRVAYIAIPDLAPSPADQAYTCLEPDRHYRYEGLFRNFSTDLEVDQHGLVKDYPTLFKRIE